MNIFEYEGEEFDKKIDEIFDKIDSSTLKKDLIECGLVVNDNLRIRKEYLECIGNIEYSNKKSIKIKTESDEKYNNINENVYEERNMIWENNQKSLVA